MKLLFRVSFIVCLVLNWHLSVAEKITAYIHNCTFLSSNHPYVETYIDISGQSLVYTLTANGKFQASVDVTIIYKPVGDTLKNDSAHIKYDKYVLYSLELNDTTHIPFDLFDLKRVSLNNDNNYNIEVDLTDEARPKLKTVLTDVIALKFDTTVAQLSDIILVDTFKTSETKTIYTKNGYDIQPRTFNFYPTEKTTLTFYSEIYNMQKAIGNNEFLVVYSITKSNDNQVVNNLRGYSKLAANAKSLILATLDITDLPSGNYLLNVEVHDKTNQLLVEKKMFFQRSNKRLVKELSNLPQLKVNTTFAQHIPKDSLIYYLKCLVPTAETYEVQYINDAVRIYDTVLARQFIYNFWFKRDSDNPQKAFKTYMSEVYFTENEFSTHLHHGFETDRGRIYLQYGKPDDREIHDNTPSALPYETWQYYSLSNSQKNVYFIFYNPDEVTNDYTLINSTAIGEIQDDHWQYKVFGSFMGGNGLQNINSNTPPSSIGTNLNTPY
jgi:GWxTD domain-containing protein